MAEIKITKKRTIWPWVIFVLVLLIALAYYFFSTNKVADESAPNYGIEKQEETGALHSNELQGDTYIRAEYLS